MRGDIGHRKIVGEEQVHQAGGAQPDQNANGESGIARGFDQKRAARDDGRNSTADRINGETEG